MQHRREIDGLRALAVIPVILFHAGFAGFSGGYVGVDVFFVISGYLITSIILSEKAAGHFTLLGFYERRARRILPALFFVISLSMVPAWFWLLPGQLKDYSLSVVAVSLFASNILFWTQSGYFEAAAELKPLLHTWSLAVEEQYYVIFPLIITIFWSLGRRWLGALIALGALASLGLSEWGWRGMQTTVFYLTPTRAWELLVGALLAFPARGGPRSLDRNFSSDFNQVASALGLAFVLVAVFGYHENTRMPSIDALTPVLGAALIIAFSHNGTLVGRLLSHPVFVGVGLISYSTYLWHQPLFAFARARSLDEPSSLALGGLSVLALALGYLTWRFIEKPFRNRRNFSRKTIFLSAAAVSACMIGVGFAGLSTDGYRGRVDQRVTSLEAYGKSSNPQNKACHSTPYHIIHPSNSCSLGRPGAGPSVALVGDSHADAISHALSNLLEGAGKAGIQMTFSACPPLRGVFTANYGKKHRCARFNDEVFSYLRATPAIETVILLSRWTLYLERRRFDNGEGGIEGGADMLVAPLEGNPTEEQRRRHIARLYKSTVEELIDMGKRVILVYPVPEVGWVVPDYLAKKAMFGDSGESDLSTSYFEFKKRNESAIEALNAIENNAELMRILPDELLCDSYVENRCIATLDGVPLYRDDDHLTNEGAAMLVGEFSRHIR